MEQRKEEDSLSLFGFLGLTLLVGGLGFIGGFIFRDKQEAGRTEFLTAEVRKDQPAPPPNPDETILPSPLREAKSFVFLQPPVPKGQRRKEARRDNECVPFTKEESLKVFGPTFEMAVKVPMEMPEKLDLSKPYVVCWSAVDIGKGSDGRVVSTSRSCMVCTPEE